MTLDKHLSAHHEAIVNRKWIGSPEEAFNNGRAARRAGKLAGTSPYMSGSEHDECWQEGYLAQAFSDEGPVDPEFIFMVHADQSPELDAAYKDGMRAAQAGQPISACPYPRTVGPGRYDSWAAGWFDTSQGMDEAGGA